MKRVVLYTNTISPHQLPMSREIAAEVGEDNFRYVYTETGDKDHGGLGWALDVPKWCVHAGAADVGEWLENAGVLLSGLRRFDLFERRAKKGLKNFYMTERWFKPPVGIARLLHPRYFGYARRLCNMMESGAVVGLPIGIHAARDMARLCGLMHGDLRCLFGAPEVEFERWPGGRIFNRVERVETCRMGGEDFNRVERVETCRGRDGKYCLEKMRMWGYFVEKSLADSRQSLAAGCLPEEDAVKFTTPPLLRSSTLKVLWVGRLLGLKRVDTIICTVGELSCARLTTNDYRLTTTLDIYGAGPEEARLKKMAAKYGDAIRFHPPVPIGDVRRLMRGHDVYVLSSNGYEGWGAVVSEALEEGMKVLGTYEAGSSATMLDESCLFHSGDWRRLGRLLEECAVQKARGELRGQGIGEWSAEKAAKWLVVSC